MSNEREVALTTRVDTTGARAGFTAMTRDAGTMAAAVARAGEQAERSVGGVGPAATRSASQVADAQRNLIGSIQRTTAAMEAGSRTGAAYYEVLARQRGVDPAALAPYLARLREIESAQTRASTATAAGVTSINRLGVSAAQTAAAMRGVPAQFTDIVTSIQGGQPVLTVLLQQGGQLKDMFGGVGAAARALGTFVAGLITPLTVGAGAVALLAVAYSQGAAESRAFNQAIILSGNAAGTTAGQLSDMARSVSQTIGTQGAAAEALNALVATGKVSASNLEQFSTVAIRAQRALGQSVGDTAKEFADLAKAPSASLEKLNDQYHFLTGATYDQVRALEQQGRTFDAGQVAQKAYATAFDGVTTKVTANLGLMERGWKHVTDGAKSAWDAMLNVGREETLAQQLDKVQQRLNANPSGALPNGLTAGAAGRNQVYAAQRAADQLQEQSLKAQIDDMDAIAAYEAESARRKDDDLAWSKTKEQFLTRQQQLTLELQSVENKGRAAHASEKEIDDALIAVRKKYSDIYNDGIDSNIAALKRRSAVEDILAKRAVDQIGFSRASGAINEEQAIEQTTAAELAAFAKRREALVQEKRLIQEKMQSKTAAADKQGEIDALDQEVISRKIKGENDLFALQQKLARLSAENFANLVDKTTGDRDALRQQLVDQQDYNSQIGLTKVQLAELSAKRLNDAAALKDQAAATLDVVDQTGQLSQLYREQAQLLRDRATAALAGANKEQQFDEWKKAVDQYSDVFRSGFADMLNNGRDGWHSFTKSLVTTFKTTVADQIYKMFAQPFVVRLVASLLGVSSDATTNLVQAASGSTSAAAGAGGYLGVAQSAKAAYEAITGGFAALSTTVADTVQAGLYATGLSGNILTNGAAATAAGTAAGYAGGLAAGKVIGSTISGQFGIGDHGSAIVNIGAVAGAFFGGPVGAAIGGAIGGLLNRAFGRGPEQVTGRSLTGTLSASGFSGTANENIHQDGGWFRSDYNGVRSTALDGTASKALSDAYEQIKMASTDFASVLGIDASNIASRTQSLNVTITTDAEANKKAIADFFVGVGDTIAQELVPSIQQFIKEGETASSTFQRIAGDYAYVDTALQAFGKQFGAVGVDSIAARERLIDAAGGLDALGRGSAFFTQNFLSEAERLAPVAKTVADEFAKLGLSGIETREQFKNVVLGLDLTTAAGVATYTGLTSIQAAFAQLHPALDGTADAARTAADILNERKDLQQQLDELTLTSAQQLAKQRDALDESNRALFDQVQAAKAAKTAQDAAKASMSDLITKYRSFADSTKSFGSGLVTGNLSPLTPEQQYAETRRQLQATVEAARNGDTNAQGNFQNIANAFLQASRVVNASDSQYNSDFANVLNLTNNLSTWASSQADSAQTSLDVMNGQLAGITQLNATMLTVAQGVTTLAGAQTWSAMGAPNTEALVSEIKSLREQLLEEVRGRRAEAAQQADAGNRTVLAAADKVVDGARDAASLGRHASAVYNRGLA